MNLKIMSIIITILGVIVFFSVIAGVDNVLFDAGYGVQYSSNCDDITLNSADALIYNATVSTVNCSYSGNATVSDQPAHLNSLPMRALFGGGGVMMLMVVGSLVFVGYNWVMKK